MILFGKAAILKTEPWCRSNRGVEGSLRSLGNIARRCVALESGQRDMQIAGQVCEAIVKEYLGSTSLLLVKRRSVYG